MNTMTSDTSDAVKRSAAFQVIPVLGNIVWHVAFLIFGCFTLYSEYAFRSEPCGKTTHLWKYLLLNNVFSFFSIMSYCTFPGGGEGARARAVTLAIFHIAFLAWGTLLWTYASETCQEVVSEKFSTVYVGLFVCIGHNFVFGSLYLAHEVYLGDCLGHDATLIAEARIRKSYLPSKVGTPYTEPKVASPYQEAIQSHGDALNQQLQGMNEVAAKQHLKDALGPGPFIDTP